MSWRDVSRVAGMSYEGLRAIRRGDRQPTAMTKARLEDALRWAGGSVDAILAGGEPAEATHRDALGAPEPELETDEEREIWQLRNLSEETRLELIAYLRTRRRLNVRREVGS